VFSGFATKGKNHRHKRSRRFWLDSPILTRKTYQSTISNIVITYITLKLKILHLIEVGLPQYQYDLYNKLHVKVSYELHHVHWRQHHITTKNVRSLYFRSSMLHARVFFCRKTITCSIENFAYWNISHIQWFMKKAFRWWSL